MTQNLVLTKELTDALGISRHYTLIGVDEIIKVLRYRDALEVLRDPDKRFSRANPNAYTLCTCDPGTASHHYFYGNFETEEEARVALTALEMLKP